MRPMFAISRLENPSRIAAISTIVRFSVVCFLRVIMSKRDFESVIINSCMFKPVISCSSCRRINALSKPSDIASVSPSKLERTTRRDIREEYEWKQQLHPSARTVMRPICVKRSSLFASDMSVKTTIHSVLRSNLG
jgi:hypothetical protein